MKNRIISFDLARTIAIVSIMSNLLLIWFMTIIMIRLENLSQVPIFPCYLKLESAYLADLEFPFF